MYRRPCRTTTSTGRARSGRWGMARVAAPLLSCGHGPAESATHVVARAATSLPVVRRSARLLRRVVHEDRSLPVVRAALAPRRRRLRTRRGDDGSDPDPRSADRGPHRDALAITWPDGAGRADAGVRWRRWRSSCRSSSIRSATRRGRRSTSRCVRSRSTTSNWSSRSARPATAPPERSTGRVVTIRSFVGCLYERLFVNYTGVIHRHRTPATAHPVSAPTAAVTPPAYCRLHRVRPHRK